MTRIREGSVSAYVPLYLPGHDVPCGEAEIIIYPIAEGAGRYDDVSVVGTDGQPYALSDAMGKLVLDKIKSEQPKVWEEIRLAGIENSSESVA